MALESDCEIVTALCSVAVLPPLQVCQLDTYFTELHWYPLSSKKNQAGGTDVFAVGCTNGGSTHTHA